MIYFGKITEAASTTLPGMICPWMKLKKRLHEPDADRDWENFRGECFRKIRDDILTGESYYIKEVKK